MSLLEEAVAGDFPAGTSVAEPSMIEVFVPERRGQIGGEGEEL